MRTFVAAARPLCSSSTLLALPALLVMACAGAHPAPESVPRIAPLPAAPASAPAVAVQPTEAPEPEPAVGSAVLQVVAPPPPEFPVTVLERPPFDAFVARPSSSPRAKLARPKLVSEARNQITDEDAWFRETGLRPASYPIGEGDLQGLIRAGLPTHVEGHVASRFVAHADQRVVFYDADGMRGRYVMVERDGEDALGPYDFAAYQKAPAPGDYTGMDTTWAQVVGDVLLVTHAHRTYAKSSGGHNAYLTGLGLDGSVRWRSAPLVANASECAVHGEQVLCGYGFTAEPDFLFVLHLEDGSVAHRIKLRSGPEHILLRDLELHVRCYDTNYLFRLAPAIEP